MNKNVWKTLAIVFGILFILETSLFVLGLSIVNNEEDIKNQCYYDLCKEYPEAYLDGDLCRCYDINEETYEYEIVKTIQIK